MRMAVVVSALLLVAGLVAFWWAAGVARKAPAKAADHAVTVTIQNKVCEPSQITVPAGRTTFTIVNQSSRALEWEILDGVMVVDERENIAPGFTQTMTVKLTPGEFQITCGLLSNPRGTLRVTPSATSEAEAARPSPVAYVGPLAEYRVFLVLASGDLQDAAQALTDAIRAGDLAQARTLYAPARQAYQRMAPMAQLFADLDQRLNARAEYFEKRQADPAFSGFHRIEYGLFGADANAAQTTALASVAEQLPADVGQLSERLRTLEVPPPRLASAAAQLLRREADNLPPAGDHHHPAQAASLRGMLEGVKKIADLLSPLLAKAAPKLDADLQQRFVACSALIDPHRDGDTFTATVLDDAQRKAVAEHLHALADAFNQVNPALGLE